MSSFGKHLAASTVVAVAAEIIANNTGLLASPAQTTAATLAAVRPGPGLVAIGVVAWLGVNTGVVARLMTDPDDSPPLIGRIAAGLIIGVPLALAELAVIGAIWWALSTA